jgi:hypothetical protein
MFMCDAWPSNQVDIDFGSPCFNKSCFVFAAAMSVAEGMSKVYASSKCTVNLWPWDRAGAFRFFWPANMKRIEKHKVSEGDEMTRNA